MVGIKEDAIANGVYENTHASKTDILQASDAQQDTTTLQDELLAAANYLQARTSDAHVIETVKEAAEKDDAITATSALLDAFLAALDVPADPEGPSSLQGCMQELLVWLRKRCNMDSSLVDKLADGLCRGTSSPTLRLRCMAFLYNSVSEQNSDKRFSLLMSTITLSASLGMVGNIVDTILPKVDAFLRQWDVQLEGKRRMYKVCYNALKSADMLDKAFTFNVKLLTLFNGSSEDELKSIEDETIDVIVQAIRLPKLYRFDTLLELDAVNRLQNMEQDYKLLYKLICIFVRDDLAVFRQFREKHDDLLAKFEIDAEVAVEKMRLLTFASLGIESPDLTYDMIASALQIPQEEVEHWVIRAISSGLVDAKINQLKSSVAIYRSSQRMFTREEWFPLSERINIWKANIGDLLTALRETRESSTTAAMEAYSG